MPLTPLNLGAREKESDVCNISKSEIIDFLEIFVCGIFLFFLDCSFDYPNLLVSRFQQETLRQTNQDHHSASRNILKRDRHSESSDPRGNTLRGNDIHITVQSDMAGAILRRGS